MMMNGWKTAKEIIDDYQLAGKDFSKLADECAKSSKYKDAVVMMHGSTGRICVQQKAIRKTSTCVHKRNDDR